LMKVWFLFLVGLFYFNNHDYQPVRA